MPSLSGAGRCCLTAHAVTLRRPAQAERKSVLIATHRPRDIRRSSIGRPVVSPTASPAKSPPSGRAAARAQGKGPTLVHSSSTSAMTQCLPACPRIPCIPRKSATRRLRSIACPQPARRPANTSPAHGIRDCPRRRPVRPWQLAAGRACAPADGRSLPRRRRQLLCASRRASEQRSRLTAPPLRSIWQARLSISEGRRSCQRRKCIRSQHLLLIGLVLASHTLAPPRHHRGGGDTLGTHHHVADAQMLRFNVRLGREHGKSLDTRKITYLNVLDIGLTTIRKSGGGTSYTNAPCSRIHT